MINQNCTAKLLDPFLSLLGHGLRLQGFSCLNSPGHLFPPMDGFGCRQYLFLSTIPAAQLTEQGDHLTQSSQPPSTSWATEEREYNVISKRLLLINNCNELDCLMKKDLRQVGIISTYHFAPFPIVKKKTHFWWKWLWSKRTANPFQVLYVLWSNDFFFLFVLKYIYLFVICRRFYDFVWNDKAKWKGLVWWCMR